MGLGDLCRQYLMNGFRHIRIVWILQIFSRVLRQPAPGRYSKVPCADHSDEPLNAGNAPPVGDAFQTVDKDLGIPPRIFL